MKLYYRLRLESNFIREFNNSKPSQRPKSAYNVEQEKDREKTNWRIGKLEEKFTTNKYH